MRALSYLTIFCVLLALFARWQGFEFSGSGQSVHHLEIPSDGPAPFHTHPIWESGKAEFCVYDSSFSKYGTQRRFLTDVITIRENFHPQRMTKADQPDITGAIPILKMNRIRRIPTGIYDYSQSLSLFASRKDPSQLIKLAFSSADGCGISYSEIKADSSGMEGDFYTYWEKGVHGKQKIAEPGTISYDQLPFYLRSKDLSSYQSENVRLLGSVFSSYLRKLPIYDCRIINLGEKSLKIGKRDMRTYHLKLQFGEMEEELFLGAYPTQPLLRWKRADGSEDRLKSLRYLYYWELTKPGDRERNI